MSEDVPVSRQAAVLGISQGPVADQSLPVPVADLALMRRIKALHLAWPLVLVLHQHWDHDSGIF